MRQHQSVGRHRNSRHRWRDRRGLSRTQPSPISGPHHRIFALSLEDGNTLPGWPIDVADALRGSQPFNSSDQNQRGALTIVGGTLYVPFGGHFGDCGDYRGWVIGSLPLQDPRKVISWSTRARGGGIWAPAGVSAVGHSLFVATGNTFGASNWSDGEAVFRLSPDLRRSNDKRDYFAPPIGVRLMSAISTSVELLPLPLTVANQPLILALGKDGRGYMLDQNNLGGIGGSLTAQAVSRLPLRTAPAVYSMNGAAYVALQGPGVSCPAPQVRVSAHSPEDYCDRTTDHYTSVVREGERRGFSNCDDNR